LKRALGALVAVLAVYGAFNATVGVLMQRRLVEVEAQLDASPATVEVRSNDLCTQLSGEGWGWRMESLLFPWAARKADALRARWRFTAEPDEAGRTCGKHQRQHVLHVTLR
jgi:hypothetical protein